MWVTRVCEWWGSPGCVCSDAGRRSVPIVLRGSQQGLTKPDLGMKARAGCGKHRVTSRAQGGEMQDVYGTRRPVGERNIVCLHCRLPALGDYPGTNQGCFSTFALSGMASAAEQGTAGG